MFTAFLGLTMNQEIFAASSPSPKTSLFDRAQEKRKIEAKESRQRASDEWGKQKATKEKKMLLLLLGVPRRITHKYILSF